MATLHHVVNDALNVLYPNLRARLEQTPATLTTVNQDVTQLTTDSVTPTPSQTSNMVGSPPSGGPTSSPLLFFVALGFGVVFTNLWIIVGVKYCFRYNARNRAMRSGNDVDPITLDNMHARPHRRKREKKLMTMDEVNERFPLTKYKTWIASRAREGFTLSGGVSTPRSQAQSIRKSSTLILPCPTSVITSDTENIQSMQKIGGGTEKDVIAYVRKRSTPCPEHEDEKTGQISEKCSLPPHDAEDTNCLGDIVSSQTLLSPDDKPIKLSSEDEDDDDDQINTILPPELLPSPGDSCAICIDILEEEDEIRGLSCDHVFHAGCLDPWLTSRRACCPLCKADYYVPKSRPEGEINEAERMNRNDHSIMPQHSQSLWNSIWAGYRTIRARFQSDSTPRDQTAPITSYPSAQLPTQPPIASRDLEVSQTRRWLGISSLSNNFMNIHLPVIRLPSRNVPNSEGLNSHSQASPSQLEAGTRS